VKRHGRSIDAGITSCLQGHVTSSCRLGELVFGERGTARVRWKESWDLDVAKADRHHTMCSGRPLKATQYQLFLQASLSK